MLFFLQGGGAENGKEVDIGKVSENIFFTKLGKGG